MENAENAGTKETNMSAPGSVSYSPTSPADADDADDADEGKPTVKNADTADTKTPAPGSVGSYSPSSCSDGVDDDKDDENKPDATGTTVMTATPGTRTPTTPLAALAGAPMTPPALLRVIGKGPDHLPMHRCTQPMPPTPPVPMGHPMGLFDRIFMPSPKMCALPKKPKTAKAAKAPKMPIPPVAPVAKVFKTTLKTLTTMKKEEKDAAKDAAKAAKAAKDAAQDAKKKGMTDKGYKDDDNMDMKGMKGMKGKKGTKGAKDKSKTGKQGCSLFPLMDAVNVVGEMNEDVALSRMQGLDARCTTLTDRIQDSLEQTKQLAKARVNFRKQLREAQGQKAVLALKVINKFKKFHNKNEEQASALAAPTAPQPTAAAAGVTVVAKSGVPLQKGPKAAKAKGIGRSSRSNSSCSHGTDASDADNKAKGSCP